MIEDSSSTTKTVLINSGNCSNQYKCIQHFSKLHSLATNKDITIVRIWSIARHGKGEVNHVGGLGKVTIRRAIGGGRLIKEFDEMVEYLESRFSNKVHLHYVFREIAAEFLKDKQTEDRLNKFRTTDGSSRFQVAVFQPGKSMFYTALYLRICKVCMEKEYGSSSLFEEYDVVIGQLKKIALPANVEEITTESQSEVVLNFAQVDTFVAIPKTNKN